MRNFLCVWMTIISFGSSQAFAFQPKVGEALYKNLKLTHMGEYDFKARGVLAIYKKQLPPHVRMALSQMLQADPEMVINKTRVEKVQQGKEVNLKYTINQGRSSLVVTLYGRDDLAVTIVGNIGHRVVNLKVSPRELVTRPEWITSLTNGIYLPPSPIHILSYEQWKSLPRDRQKAYVHTLMSVTNQVERYGPLNFAVNEKTNDHARNVLFDLLIPQAHAYISPMAVADGVKCIRAMHITEFRNGICGGLSTNALPELQVVSIHDSKYQETCEDVTNSKDPVKLESDRKGVFGPDQSLQCLQKSFKQYDNIETREQYTAVRNFAEKQIKIIRGVCNSKSLKSQDQQQTCAETDNFLKEIIKECEQVSVAGRFKKLNCIDSSPMAIPALAAADLTSPPTGTEQPPLSNDSGSLAQGSKNGGLYSTLPGQKSSTVQQASKATDKNAQKSILAGAAAGHEQQKAAAQTGRDSGVSIEKLTHPGSVVSGKDGKGFVDSTDRSVAANQDGDSVSTKTQTDGKQEYGYYGKTVGTRADSKDDRQVVVDANGTRDITAKAVEARVTPAPAAATPAPAAATPAPAAATPAPAAATPAPAAATPAPAAATPAPAAVTPAPAAATPASAAVTPAPVVVDSAKPAATHGTGTPVRSSNGSIVTDSAGNPVTSGTGEASNSPPPELPKLPSPDICETVNRKRLKCDDQFTQEFKCSDGSTALQCVCPSGTHKDRTISPVDVASGKVRQIVVECENIEAQKKAEEAKAAAEAAEEKAKAAKAEAQAEQDKKDRQAKAEKNKAERDSRETNAMCAAVIAGCLGIGIQAWAQKEQQKSYFDYWSRIQNPIWSTGVGTSVFRPTPPGTP